MARALDCIHEAHEDMHFSASNDDELLQQVLEHRDEKHPELSDDDMRGIVSANAHDE